MVKKTRKLILCLFIFGQMGFFYFFKLPTLIPGETANFTNASDTLSNARLSYRAGVNTGAASSSTVKIDTSGHADNDTNHLFPKDVVCFAGGNLDGCYSQSLYTVANIIDTDDFNFTPALGGTALDANDYVIASQSAIHTVAFTLASAVPLDGDILITIPTVDITGKTNDSFPDTNSSIATNGFDRGGVVAADVSTSSSGCTNNWNSTETFTNGDASNDMTIRIDRNTDSCAAGATITVTVGSTNKLINPAPISTGHTQGNADVYTINVKTRDGSDQTLDQSNIKVAVIEGVLVSATVQETLTVTVAGVSADSGSYCGVTRDASSPDSTATSVPWGTITTFAAFRNAVQTVTVSTNADAGYSVKAEENDQMGKDGKTCNSPTADTADETDSCIQDTTCNTLCSESSSDEWTTTTKYGLGFSMANVSGTDASFLYNESARTFSSRQFADQQASNTKQNIMANGGPVAASQAYLCYRLNVSATQPAGYYYNKVQMTATATF
ncbi:hypothetical protein HZA76_00025 [Candidatus Roizmanbacteria bacterium]|nr:hypothetical protein [Candidatus Roizmanbacteria bacterium]